MVCNTFQGGDVVLSGPPNSGKTTLIQALKAIGRLIIPEVATQLIEEGIHPLEQPERFDCERWMRQLHLESKLPPQPRPAYLDRGLFDTIAYRRAYNQSLPGYINDTPGPRYGLMLLLAPCPWTEDGVRYEGNGDIKKVEAFQIKITTLLEQAYRERGVPVIQVPLMPHAERLRFVLEALRLCPSFAGNTTP